MVTAASIAYIEYHDLFFSLQKLGLMGIGKIVVNKESINFILVMKDLLGKTLIIKDHIM